MRINNLEFRKASYLGEEPEHPSYHIDLWEPNFYYGRESEYILDESGDFYHDPKYEFHHIHKSCFRNPETCYAIASFDYDSHEGFYEVKFIGDRPLDADFNQKDFWKLLQYGNTKLNYSNDEID